MAVVFTRAGFVMAMMTVRIMKMKEDVVKTKANLIKIRHFTRQNVLNHSANIIYFMRIFKNIVLLENFNNIVPLDMPLENLNNIYRYYSTNIIYIIDNLWGRDIAKVVSMKWLCSSNLFS